MKRRKNLVVLASMLLLLTFSIRAFAFANVSNSSNELEITQTEEKENADNTEVPPPSEEPVPEPTDPVEGEIPIDHNPISSQPGNDPVNPDPSEILEKDTTLTPSTEVPVDEKTSTPVIEEVTNPADEPSRTTSIPMISSNNLNPNLNYNDLEVLALQLAQNLVGGNMPISNAKITGVPEAFGTFSDKSSIIGFSDGIILSTGRANGIFDYGYDTLFSYENDVLSNASVSNPVPGENIHDVALLEFDVKPSYNQLTFQYVLASEEYPEFLEYFDKFILDINGVNYAKLPNGEEVTIGNVNHIKNARYYRGVTIDKSIENATISPEGAISTTSFVFNGATVVLSISAPVKANELNHIRLAIGDYKDTYLDSAVFIKAEGEVDKEVKPGELSINYMDGDVFVISRNNGTDGYISLVWTAYNYKGEAIGTGSSEFNDGVKFAEITGPEGVFKVVISEAIGEAKIAKAEASKPNYPPTLKLSGMPKSLYIDDKFNPKDYITVSDDYDDLTVDDIIITLSGTPTIKDGKLTKSGTLKIKYTVKDNGGLTAEVTGTLKVKERPKKPTLPQTGGDSSSALALVLGSSLTLSGVGIYRKRK